MNEILRMAHLILIALGTGMAASHYVVLRASAGHDAETGRAMALARRTLGDITSMVLVLIWISGLTLLWAAYGLGERQLSAWFYAKIAFVVLLTVAHVGQRVTARRGSADEAATRRVLERWVSVVWLSALLAICFAVISFADQPL